MIFIFFPYNWFTVFCQFSTVQMIGLGRCGVYIHNRIPLSHKKNKIMPLAATWMELETLILNEVSQKEKDKYHMISLISGVQYMAQRNLSIEKKITGLENRLVVAKGEGKGVGWIGSLGLIDADCCLWTGLAMRSCCVALATMSGHL